MDIVLEQFRGVENVIYNDYSAQSHDSEVWLKSRKIGRASCRERV